MRNEVGTRSRAVRENGAIDIIVSTDAGVGTNGLAGEIATGATSDKRVGGPATTSTPADNAETCMSRSAANDDPTATAGDDTSSGWPLRMQWLVRPEVLASAALLLSFLGVAVAAFTSAPDDRGGVHAVIGQLAGPLTQYQLPEMTADLKPTGRKPHFVQLIAVVEVTEDAVSMLQQQEFAIIAEVQAWLRDRDRSTLIGNRGAEQLREEMISIANARIAPHRVSTVLFTRFLLD